jgi:hypothetical protein
MARGLSLCRISPIQIAGTPRTSASALADSPSDFINSSHGISLGWVRVRECGTYQLPSMVVDDPDHFGTALPPHNADAPLIDYPDTVLPVSIALERFEAGTKWRSQNFRAGLDVELAQHHPRIAWNRRSASPRTTPRYGCPETTRSPTTSQSSGVRVSPGEFISAMHAGAAVPRHPLLVASHKTSPKHRIAAGASGTGHRGDMPPQHCC